MNAHNSPSTWRVEEEPSDIAENKISGFTRWLRIGGALALFSSGVIYMLQGFDNVHLDLRYWIFIALMAVLGLGGIFSHKLMDDNKGARLFFGLGMLMVPVQFAQLGAMVLDVFGRSANQTIAALSPLFVSVNGVISLLVAAGISFAAFSILCRKFRQPLLINYFILIALMLIPLREFPLGLISIVAMALVSFRMHSQYFARNIEFSTWEGWGVRLAFIVPLFVVLGRACFYVQSELHISMLGLVVAFLTFQQSRALKGSSLVRELFLMLSYLFGAAATISLFGGQVKSLRHFFDVANAIVVFAYFWPAMVITFAVSLYSQRLAGLYRSFAVVLILASLLMAYSLGSTLAQSLMLLTAIGYVTWGFFQQRKILMLAGVFSLALSVAPLSLTLLHSVQVSAWVSLSILGVVVLVLSSVVEKYGRSWILRARSGVKEMGEWSYY